MMKGFKDRMQRAIRSDFEIIKEDQETDEDVIRWIVSLHGCDDLAWFLRKADAERFVKSFPIHRLTKAMLDSERQLDMFDSKARH